jgi:hypothetical protein
MASKGLDLEISSKSLSLIINPFWAHFVNTVNFHCPEEYEACKNYIVNAKNGSFVYLGRQTITVMDVQQTLPSKPDCLTVEVQFPP